jgi:hypothetical protein
MQGAQVAQQAPGTITGCDPGPQATAGQPTFWHVAPPALPPCPTWPPNPPKPVVVDPPVVLEPPVVMPVVLLEPPVVVVVVVSPVVVLVVDVVPFGSPVPPPPAGSLDSVVLPPHATAIAIHAATVVSPGQKELDEVMVFSRRSEERRV